MPAHHAEPCKGKPFATGADIRTCPDTFTAWTNSWRCFARSGLPSGNAADFLCPGLRQTCRRSFTCCQNTQGPTGDAQKHQEQPGRSGILACGLYRHSGHAGPACHPPACSCVRPRRVVWAFLFAVCRFDIHCLTSRSRYRNCFVLSNGTQCCLHATLDGKAPSYSGQAYPVVDLSSQCGYGMAVQHCHGYGCRSAALTDSFIHAEV